MECNKQKKLNRFRIKNRILRSDNLRYYYCVYFTKYNILVIFSIALNLYHFVTNFLFDIYIFYLKICKA